MIRYLVDSSALWRLVRDISLARAWDQLATQGALGSCAPQRTEFRRSARSLDHYEQLSEMFRSRYPDVPVSKTVCRWIESAQYRLARSGAIGALSAVDLMVCATAAGHGLVVLHDDNDFATAARYLPDIVEHRVHLPPPEA